MSCRSDNLKTGVARAPHRSLLKALGFVDEEMGRPVIGIANSFNEIIPGHVGLKNIVQAVKDGIRNAGGVPIEFSWLCHVTNPHAANRQPSRNRAMPNTMNGQSTRVKSIQEKSRSRTARLMSAGP